MFKRLLAIFALFGLCTAAVADPAAWYWWVSLLDGSRACSQTPLGEGWVQEPKPFKDSLCRVPLNKQ